ncbi:MAG: hypothetical protein HN718_00770 [Rhodospirillales bacterium]|jgi:hypothetical protein|nr:hypothetical protein [Rhodospirillales bacterium]MBT4039015.1 hypothetical protein [Rhodospirillales bacterium]MBT5522163.1 hypothetical protein [Rhodospirillales bacterium]MBT6110724.1 hypothetical protein [Rhodospirillales bacterium]MBT7777031.1 hypothetical protein [Rhodospirillales bacterium]
MNIRSAQYNIITLVLYGILATGCSAASLHEPPQEQKQVFDPGAAKLTFERAMTIDMEGDGEGSIALIRRAIDMFPIDSNYYRALAKSANRAGDAEVRHYAEFFAARLETNMPSGPEVTAATFRTVALVTLSGDINAPDVKETALKIVLLLETILCLDKHKQNQDRFTNLSIIEAYGFQSWIQMFNNHISEHPECEAIIRW